MSGPFRDRLAQPGEAAPHAMRSDPRTGLATDPAHGSNPEEVLDAFASAIEKSRFRG